MTAQELRQWVNDFGNKFGIETPLPDHLEVDHETYANVCQYIFDSLEDNDGIKNLTMFKDGTSLISLRLGRNWGIMFKGIELILKEKK